MFPSRANHNRRRLGQKRQQTRNLELSCSLESVENWEKRIAELEIERDQLQKKLLEIPENQRGPLEVVIPPAFEKLGQANASLQIALDTAQQDLEKVYQNREQWQQSVLAASAEVIESMRTMMLKRDAENARLREQRDQHFSELVERRQRDERKWAALVEFKELTQNQTERIAVLRSELARCKARLAANERQEDLLQFFLKGKPRRSSADQ
ncbi:hypothetical protein FA13DRAFT_1266344 [Coprinellus micaceus]|uniref:Uncharacterized protein n=1 Tax=Coprinellus micaceus TaxID=71717 RepID=A0A4Y7R8P9_COPMI|nr:hypothetical protein FA13DRAFT_1266344 [Coprinellus micaceus]